MPAYGVGRRTPQGLGYATLQIPSLGARPPPPPPPPPPHPPPPPALQAPFYLVVETSGSHAGHDGEKLERFLEGVMGEELVLGEPQWLQPQWSQPPRS